MLRVLPAAAGVGLRCGVGGAFSVVSVRMRPSWWGWGQASEAGFGKPRGNRGRVRFFADHDGAAPGVLAEDGHAFVEDVRGHCVVDAARVLVAEPVMNHCSLAGAPEPLDRFGPEQTEGKQFIQCRRRFYAACRSGSTERRIPTVLSTANSVLRVGLPLGDKAR